MGDIAVEAEPKPVDPRLPRMWVRPYYGSFNGLRGIAVAMTFFCRFGDSFQSIAENTLWAGVDLFFVLSGFLITGILYDSLANPHYFRSFYKKLDPIFEEIGYEHISSDVFKQVFTWAKPRG